MAAVKSFFLPLFKVLLFILATVWGAKILYSEVIFPGYNFLPFEIYNPILDLTMDRFLFRLIFFLWSILLYLFAELILTKKKWKRLTIIQEKHKLVSFLKGNAAGLIYIGLILITLLVLNFFKISEAFLNFKTAFPLLIGYFIAIITTAFFLELIFRATALEILQKNLNIHLSNLIVSVLFASIFIFSKSEFHPMKQLFLSMLLGYIYHKYGFYRTFGFHFCFDYIESLFFSNIIFNVNLKRLPDFTALTELNIVSSIFLIIGVTWLAFNLNKRLKKRKKQSS